MKMKHKIIYRFLEIITRPYTLGLINGIKGLDNVPKKGGFIIVANHESYLDPPIIKAMIDKYFKRIVYYLTKKEAYDKFFKKLFFDIVGTISVDRQKGDITALNEAIKTLKEGGIIGIFPEGTRSRDGKLHKGKTGAVRIALAAKYPIIPIGIQGTYELWPPHQKLPKRKKKVIISIGKPISLEKYYNQRVTKELLREVTDKIIMPEIAKLSNQIYDPKDE